MQIKLKPRFYLIVGCLTLGLILFGSSTLFKKKIEVKVIDNSDQGKVLAADIKNQPRFNRGQESGIRNQEGSYDLVGGEIGGEIGGPLGSNSDTGPSTKGDISAYEPVTIAHEVKEGDTLQSIAAKYHADPQTIADFPNNGLQDSLELKVGQILIIPNGYVDDSQRPVLPPIARGTGQFAWPVRLASLAQGRPIRDYITQYAFYWHAGAIDIALDTGTPITAADDGTVKTVERLTTGYGTHVVIEHGDGLTSLYAHLSSTDLVVGQGIRKGDMVGLSGSTGRSTGPHLHFEVRRNGAPVDPMTLLPSQ